MLWANDQIRRRFGAGTGRGETGRVITPARELPRAAAPAGSPLGDRSPLYGSETSFDNSECLVEQRPQRPNVFLGVPDAHSCGQGPDQRRGDHLDLELARVSPRGARQRIGDELARLVGLPRRRSLQVGVIERVAELATGEFFVTAEEGRHHRGERPPHRLHRWARDELRLECVDQPEIELVVKDDPFLLPSLFRTVIFSRK
jgi:hypothetical protein